MKKILILVLLCTLCAADTIPRTVLNGYYPGRSGDIVIYDKTLKQEDSFIVVFGEGTSLPEEFTEREVAEFITQSMGMPPLAHEQAPHFDINNFFSKPEANVLIIVESARGDLTVTKGKSASKIVKESFPYSSVAHTTTMITGVTPAKHGIVGAQWLDRMGVSTQKAFSSWNPVVAGSSSPNIQDHLTLISGGQSLIFSIAAEKSMARTLAAKPFVAENANSFGLYWEGSAFDSIYEDKIPQLLLSRDSILSAFVADGTIETDSLFFYITVEGERVGFDLRKDFGLLSEVAVVEAFAARLADHEFFDELTKDSAQDFYSFAFSAVGQIEAAYGEHSRQFVAAMHLVNNAIEQVFEAVDSVYRNVVKEIVRVPATPQQSLLADEINSKLAKSLPSDKTPVYNTQTFYPQVYLENVEEDKVRKTVCEDLEQSLTDFGVEVECMPAPSPIYNSIMDELEASSSEGDSDTATYQIAVWTTVGLIFAFAAGSYTMTFVDASTDSLLYANDINHPSPVNRML
eukprot:TRINITY_DN3381_c0_g1_i1.p1 TRINITY_DN3381_c0_g1~~TRINITY_DN3381_c0_g1_i1.p1  ORF type:complete len:516 (-),score=90.33 TRINITY_DN3381_c0_g1_i1:30-1577(-)